MKVIATKKFFFNVQIGANTGSDATGCTELVRVPGLSPDGVLPIPVPTGVVAYQDEICGVAFGIEGVNIPQALVCK